jgi:apolipoprotein N-acyltransferase
VGSVIERRGQYFQAVFWLHKSLIINFYVKKLLTPFVEKMPATWKKIQFLKKPFIGDTVEFCDGKNGFGAEFFDIGNLRVVPRICLEFFFCKPGDFDEIRKGHHNVWVFLFANDSWFDKYFRKLLFLSAKLKANYINLPVVYSGHFDCYKIVPETM